MFRQSYTQSGARKEPPTDQRLSQDSAVGTKTCAHLRDNIERHQREAMRDLDQILLDRFRKLGVKFEQATWDVTKKKPGKAKKRDVTQADIEALHAVPLGL